MPKLNKGIYSHFKPEMEIPYYPPSMWSKERKEIFMRDLREMLRGVSMLYFEEKIEPNMIQEGDFAVNQVKDLLNGK